MARSTAILLLALFALVSLATAEINHAVRLNDHHHSHHADGAKEDAVSHDDSQAASAETSPASDLDDVEDLDGDVDDLDDLTESEAEVLVYHIGNFTAGWHSILTEAASDFPGTDLDEFNGCGEDLESCVRRVIKEPKPIATFAGSYTSAAFIELRDKFSSFAEVLSTMAFFCLLVVEFFREHLDIQTSVRSRDAWERVSNRLFEIWMQVSLPRLMTGGAIKKVPGIYQDTPVFKNNKIISYMHLKKYEVNQETSMLARQMVGVFQPSRNPLYVEDCEENKKCESCGKMIRECETCLFGLTRILDALAAPLQSHRSSLEIFRVFFDWEIFADLDRLRGVESTTLIRRDMELLTFDFWKAVADRASYFWRLVRQTLILCIFLCYFVFSLQADFLALVVFALLKTIMFGVGYTHFINSKTFFNKANSFNTWVHVGECFMILWVFFANGGEFRSAAITWRIFKEIEIYPMMMVLRVFPWWYTQRTKIFQMVWFWIKSTFTVGKDVATCQVEEDADTNSLRRGEDSNKGGSFQAIKQGRSSVIMQIKKSKAHVKNKLASTQEKLENFQYLSMSQEGYDLLLRKVESWLDATIKGRDGIPVVWVGAQERYHYRNFRARRIIPTCSVVLSRAIEPESINLNLYDAKMYQCNNVDGGLRLAHAFEYGGVFGADVFMLANTTYWFNSYNFQQQPGKTISVRGASISTGEVTARAENQSELDLGSAIVVRDIKTEWDTWEKVGSLGESMEPVIQLTNDAIEKRRRQKAEEEEKKRVDGINAIKSDEKKYTDQARRSRSDSAQADEQAAKLQSELDDLEKFDTLYPNIMARNRVLENHLNELVAELNREKDAENRRNQQ